ncbi:hypothetical protein BC827DRAFT_456562 [Russula dissimulans]|nr:hypothetical protein BC827DRAFT_456562 [Russula dissimulans]
MALAVALVLIWKYWGRAIKRTERKQRKEVLDMLAVRENTRRNATTGYKPQSQYRPTLKLNPEGRKVTFLNRSPTSPRSKRNNKNATPLAPTSTDPAEYEQKGNNQGVPAAGPSTDLTRQSSQTQILALAPAPQLVNERPEPEQNEGGGERSPIEEIEVIPPRDTSSPTPSRSTSIRAPSPTPSGSSPRRVPSPTPSRDTPKRTSQLTPSRSTRMRTPRALPDPPSTGLVPPRMANMQPYVPSPSGPRIFASPPVSPATSSSDAHEMLATSSISSYVPLVRSPPVAVAGPSSSSSSFSRASSRPTLTMTSSPLRRSVLPSSSAPVIMPQAKRTSTLPSPTDSQPSPLSAASSQGFVPPSLAGSASQYSTESGDRPVRRSYFESLRHFRAPAAGTAGANALRMSTQSSASAYSND